VKLLERHPNRFALMRLNDMREGTRTGLLAGSEDVRNDVALGTGQIDQSCVRLAGFGMLSIHQFIGRRSG
jgi:hypothetical protein